MDVATEAYLTLLQIFGMNVTLKNRFRNITRSSVFYCLFFFFSKSWLVVTLKIKFPAARVCISPLRRARICKSRAMKYFPCLVFSSLRGNYNSLLFRVNLKPLCASVSALVQVASDASFLHKGPNTTSKILLHLEETQP